MSEQLILEPLADAGEVAKKPTDELWTYSESTKEVNKIVETNGVTFPIYGTSDDNEQIGTSVDGKPVYVGDRYRVKVEWKDMVHNFDTRTWDTTDLKWDFPQGAWDNLSEHNEIKITNYSSQAIDVTFEVTPNPGFESITYSFDKAANTDDPVGTLRIAAADQGKTGDDEDLNVPQEAIVYLNLHGIPSEAIGKDMSELIGQVTVRINDFTKERPQAGITLDKTQLNLDEIGVNEQLIATFIPENPEDDTTITWTSSDETIATVDSDGMVTSVANGSATITASSMDGKYSAQCTVTVNTAGFPSLFLFSNFDETNRTVTLAGSVKSTMLIRNLVIPKEINITSKTHVGGGKYSVMQKSSGEMYTVTAIGDYAFASGSILGTLALHDSITSIGIAAFAACPGLTGKLIIPNSVVSIGSEAFSNCRGFHGALILPDSLYSIGRSAFQDCIGLTGPLNIPDSVASIGASAFSGCSNFTQLTLSNALTSIGAKAFFECSGMRGKLIIPNSVASIGEQCFYKCNGFTGDAVLSDSLMEIPELAFTYCAGLDSVIFPNSLGRIAKSAFNSCVKLSSLDIPKSVGSIDASAFSLCHNLQTITIHRNKNSIADAPWGAVNATIKWVG